MLLKTSDGWLSSSCETVVLWVWVLKPYYLLAYSSIDSTLSWSRSCWRLRAKSYWMVLDLSVWR